MEYTITKQEVIDFIVKKSKDDSQFHTWFDNNNGGRRLDNYDDFAREYARCRDPKKGRKISASFRLFKDEPKYSSKDPYEQLPVSYTMHIEGYGSKPFMRITPDNLVEFVCTSEEVWRHSQSLVSSCYRWIPFNIERHKKGLYRINHVKTVNKNVIEGTTTKYQRLLEMAHALPNDADEHTLKDLKDKAWYGSYALFSEAMRESPAFFQGLKFNILTGECLNRRPDDKFVEKPEERKVWRQALAKFKRGIKARAKVRAFDPLIAKVWADRQGQSHYHHKQPDWSSKPWLDLLEQSIRNNEFSKELLLGFCATPPSGYYQQTQPTSKEVFDGVHKILTDMSTELRRRFNVFEKEGHDEKRGDKYTSYHHEGGMKIEEVTKL
jgi:hypothetical protein